MVSNHDGAGLVAALRREGLLVLAPTVVPTPTEITTDNRHLTAGAAFVAVRGSLQDGHQYAGAAVDAGAGLLIVERPVERAVPQVIVTDGRLAAIALARWWFDDPARKLSLVGVTGTSGKTTTTLLVRHLLNADGLAGSIGTLGAFGGAGETIASTAGSLTTPGPVDLQATLAGLVTAGVKRVAMETSSHSLDQGRLDGLTFDGAVFTNLSREHLDYHRTMGEYRAAKLRLLHYLSPTGIAAVNTDDPAWDDLAGAAAVVSFGTKSSAQVRAEDVVLLPAESRFMVRGRFGTAAIELPLPGEFNVLNALGAAAVVLGMGGELGPLADRLRSAPQVPGRMERLAERPCLVIRDYAHKPDALDRVLKTLRPITPGRLICLFGCGGDRDKGKRPIMGRIAAELSDLTVVTSDNPRTEDPGRIIEDIVAGIPKGSPIELRVDRREAIATALATAKPGDTELLAGQGHETYQVIGTEYLPFDERAIVAGLIGSPQ